VHSYHILICEDDWENLQLNRENVEHLCEEWNRPIMIHESLSAEEALCESIEQIDIAILDIELHGENGLQFAKRLQKKKPEMPIIFITSYAQYREEAGCLYAIGLLKKPVDNEKFKLLLKRSFAQIDMERDKEKHCFLEIVINKKPIKIKMLSIISIEKMQKKVIIKTNSGIYEVRDTIKAMELKLIPCFLKISQSVIVNMNEILCIEGNDVYMSTHDFFRMGRTYQKEAELTYRKFGR